MQKFVELRSFGTKLQIISAFAVENVKGFIYIEADKQCDVMEVIIYNALEKQSDSMHFFLVAGSSL